MNTIKTIKQTLKGAVRAFAKDEAILLAAALAFFTVLSLAPLLILLVTLGAYLGEETVQGIVEQVQASLGSTAGDAIEQMLANAKRQKVAATWSAVIGIATIMLGAAAAFVHLQKSLNKIFNVQTKAGYVTAWLYKRALSLLMVIAVGILLVVVPVLSSVLTWVFPEVPILSRGIAPLVSLVLFLLIFTIMYKVLPDVRIAWKDTFIGAFITAVLFLVAQWLISFYLSRKGTLSVYGAAGSLFLLLLWTFYTGIVVLFGAELTQAYTECCGSEVKLNKFAQWDETAPKKKRERTKSGNDG